jgi:hypothetical protein
MVHLRQARSMCADYLFIGMYRHNVRKKYSFLAFKKGFWKLWMVGVDLVLFKGKKNLEN